MQKDKIDSLLGFAVRAGKILYGADNITTVSKRQYAIFMSYTTAPKTAKRIIEYATMKKIPLVETQKELQDIVFKQNCKVLAVIDRQMAQAMLDNLNNNFQLYVAEVK